MGGYGEDAWYDTRDHTALHADLERDLKSTLRAIGRRPALQRSVNACPTCTALIGATAPLPAAEPPPRREIAYTLTPADIEKILGLDPGFRFLHAYVERGTHIVLVVQCPDEPEPVTAGRPGQVDVLDDLERPAA